jgi:hypothetical protein
VTNRVLINLLVTAELRAAAGQSARESGTTVSDICREALVRHVAIHAAGSAPVVERCDV